MSAPSRVTRLLGLAKPAILVAWLITPLALAGIVGCGPKSELLGVSGEVSLDGTPVKNGSIQLTSVGAAKVSATGALIKDGKYEIPQAKGLPPGKYQIMISSGDESAQAGRPARELIPPEYNVNSQKTLDITVDGENHFVFDIMSK